MPDPLADLIGQLNQNMNVMSQQFIKGMDVLNTVAPHNVLASLFKGAGTFSAAMTTSEIDRRNIF
jgi:hypothetical protein